MSPSVTVIGPVPWAPSCSTAPTGRSGGSISPWTDTRRSLCTDGSRTGTPSRKSRASLLNIFHASAAPSPCLYSSAGPRSSSRSGPCSAGSPTAKPDPHHHSLPSRHRRQRKPRGLRRRTRAQENAAGTGGNPGRLLTEVLHQNSGRAPFLVDSLGRGRSQGEATFVAATARAVFLTSPPRPRSCGRFSPLPGSRSRSSARPAPYRDRDTRGGRGPA